MFLVKKLVKCICLFSSIIGLMQVGYTQEKAGMDEGTARRGMIVAFRDNDLLKAKTIYGCYGGLPDYESTRDKSWIHEAAADNAVDILAWLINACGFTGVECDFVGATPAHYAAQNGSVGILLWLYQNIDCAFDSVDERGNFPIDLMDDTTKERFLSLLSANEPIPSDLGEENNTGITSLEGGVGISSLFTACS